MMDKYFGFRAGYILLAYFVLRTTLLAGNVPLAVTFGSLVLFLVPFVFEYSSMLSASSVGRIVREVGFWFSVAGFCISLTSMFYGIYSNHSSVTENKIVHILNYPISLETVWKLCGFWLVLGLIDWIVYSTEEEKRFREELRNREREKHGTISFQERVDHYKGRKAEG